MGAHGAVASYAFGEEVWRAVEADWRTAPIDERLRAMLGFIEKLTLRPDELGPADAEAAVLGQIREARGVEPIGVLKTLYYRPELFGRPYSEALDLTMRGPSDWTDADRELFAGFVSSLNQCPF